MYITDQTSKIRTRGKKMPKNYIKTSIVLFLSQGSKSTTEIREYLKAVHHIAESRGVRLHLERLCNEGILEKTVRNGIGTCYFWKKDLESFRKIINMISKNHEIIRDILRERYRSKTIKKKTRYDLNLLKRIHDDSVPFDTVSFWYNTDYAKSFVTNDTIEYFVNMAYKKCSQNISYVKYFSYIGIKPTYNDFRAIFLENNDTDTLRILMRYSPSLVLHIVNLQDSFQTRVDNLDERKDLIFQMIVKDNLMRHYKSHGGGIFPVANIDKILDKKGNSERVDASISYSFYDEGREPLLVIKKKSVQERK